jgi:hypothetical protein
LLFGYCTTREFRRITLGFLLRFTKLKEILNGKWLFEKKNPLTASVPITNCLNREVHPNFTCPNCVQN